MTLYTINRADFFKAQAEGFLPAEPHIVHAGSVWMDIFLTEEQRAKYPYWIEVTSI